MKEKSKNGFTLVEVLGVIVILGILALLVTNGIMGYFNEGKGTYNDKLKDQLTISGKNYFSDNRYLLPTEVTDKKYAYVTVPEMQSDNYIKNEFLDSEGRKCTESYVFVREATPGTNKYEYTPCLICEGINYSEESGYCDPSLWKTESVEENGDHAEDEPETPIVGEFACSGTYETSTGKTIITASSSYKINRMYYVIGDGTDQTNLTLTDEEKSNGKITQKAFTGIPQGANVFIEDMQGNISSKCNIEDCQCTKLSLGYSQGTASCNSCECKSPKIEKTINGVKHCTEANVPVCSFTSLPTLVGTLGKQFEVTCTNEVGIKTLNNSNIVANDSNAAVSITNLNVVNNGTSSKETNGDNKTIKFTGLYRPVRNLETTGKIKIKTGLVGNVSDESRQNSQVISNSIQIDTKNPVITFKVTTGSTMKSESSKESYTGYKDTVKVQVQCTDSGSGVKTFKVDGTATSSPKTVTYNTRGNHTLSVSCTDKAGNTTTASKSYRVCKSASNCDKCGIKSYKSCQNSSCKCKTYKANCSKCGGVESKTTCYKHTNKINGKAYESAQLPSPRSNNVSAYCNNNCSVYKSACSIKVYSYKLIKEGGGHTYLITPYTCKSQGSYSCSYSPKKYSSCYRCSAAGCETRYSCEHSSCGVKECKSCYYCS